MDMPTHDTDEPTRREKSRLSKVLLYVLGPAIIAGLFSLLPKVYEVVTKERAILSYYTVSGPAIPVEGAYRRIFSLTVKNEGRAVLNNVQIQLQVSNGSIETVSVERNILRPAVISNPAEYNISVPRILPGEHLSSSLMTIAQTADASLDIAARTDEVAGTAKDPARGSDEKLFPTLLGALFAAMSVGAMAIVFMLRRMRGESDAEFLRPQVVTLLAHLTNLFPEGQETVLWNDEIPYAGLADALLFAGRRSRIDKSLAIAGLRALLLVGPMAPSSKLIVGANLRLLGHTDAKDIDELRHKGEEYNGEVLKIRSGILEIFNKLSHQAGLSDGAKRTLIA